MYRCYKCGIDKEEENFLPSDIRCRVYMCKPCKKEYRKQRRNKVSINSLPSTLICRICNLKKPKKLFGESRLKDGDYICRKCKCEQDITYQNEVKEGKRIPKTKKEDG